MLKFRITENPFREFDKYAKNSKTIFFLLVDFYLLDGLAPLLPDPYSANSTTRQNPLIFNPPHYIGVISTQIMQLKKISY